MKGNSVKCLMTLSVALVCCLIASAAHASFDGSNFTADTPVTLFNAISSITISNAYFGDSAYSAAAILVISNISSTNILVDWAAPASAIGLETTNQLLLPSGKFAVYTINTFLSGFHTYEVHLAHNMPALPGSGNGGSTGGGGLGGDYLANGLMAYWKLSDGNGATAIDSSGNSNTASLIGSPRWGTNSLILDGVTQYGDAGPGATEVSWHDMSISAWVMKTGYSIKSIIDKSFSIPGTGVGGWGLRVQEDGHLSFWGGQSCIDFGGETVIPGKWTFVTTVWHSDSQGADFYLNGILNSTVHNSATMNYATFGLAHLQLGNMQNNLGNGAYIFDGALRDIGVYNRALSAAEIKTNFLLTELDTNVVAPDLLYLKMNEGVLNETNATLKLADSSAAANTNVVLYYPYPVIWKPNQAGVSNVLHFNGVSTYVDTHAGFNFTTNVFTINFWLQPDAAGTELMANGFNHANGWRVYLSSTYQVVLAAETDGAETSIATGADIANNSSLTMITVVRTGPTTALIYVNGQQTATTGSFTNPVSSLSSLVIGSNKEGTSWYDGDLSQPQIWSTALSPSDVANLYFNQVRGVAWP